jgi:hypothetical protein
MVGTTGIEPVTPTMSTQRADGNYSEIPANYPSDVRKRSRLDHGNFGRFLGAETMQFAQAVALAGSGLSSGPPARRKNPTTITG